MVQSRETAKPLNYGICLKSKKGILLSLKVKVYSLIKGFGMVQSFRGLGNWSLGL